MFKKIDTWTVKTTNFFLVATLLIASIIIFINVILRFFWGSGIPASFEIVRFLLVGITFLGSSLLIVNNEHLSMDALDTILPVPVKKVIDLAICFIGIIFSTIIFFYSFKVMNAVSSNLTPELQIPSFIPYIFITMASFLIILRFIQRIIILYKEGGDKK